MNTKGGFTYWLDKKQLKGYDSWEKAIKNLEVKTDVIKLEVHATTV